MRPYMNPSNFKQQVKTSLLESRMRRVGPIMVGPISVEFHLRLSVAEEVLEELVDDKVLRRATPAEKRQYDIQGGYFLV
jgi:hypothetical protein